VADFPCKKQSKWGGDLAHTAFPKANQLRNPHDFYPTVQADPIVALLDREQDRLGQSAIWEPAVGKGHLADVMKARGYAVCSSDLVDYGYPHTQVRDFYDFTHSPARAIITNPPYNLISSRGGATWMKHTLGLTGWDYCAYLLSSEWPYARINGLGELLDQTPFSYCYMLRWKIDFSGQGQPKHRTAWFVWDRQMDPKQYGQVRFLDKPTAPQRHG